MSSANTKTGRDGKFVVETTLIARCIEWGVNSTLASSSEWGDSDSGGWTSRAEGRRDATFTANGKYDTSNEAFDLFEPGVILIAVLWLDNVDLYWDFPRAMCTDFNLSVNIDSEEVIGWTSSWGTDGICYRPGAASATARVLP